MWTTAELDDDEIVCPGVRILARFQHQANEGPATPKAERLGAGVKGVARAHCSGMDRSALSFITYRCRRCVRSIWSTFI